MLQIAKVCFEKLICVSLSYFYRKFTSDSVFANRFIQIATENMYLGLVPAQRSFPRKTTLVGEGEDEYTGSLGDPSSESHKEKIPCP
jgi:hypothetical protein